MVSVDGAFSRFVQYHPMRGNFAVIWKKRRLMKQVASIWSSTQSFSGIRYICKRSLSNYGKKATKSMTMISDIWGQPDTNTLIHTDTTLSMCSRNFRERGFGLSETLSA